ncbi:MAG TPA: response regulator transcription factor [Terriglobales bacterium]|nr:response regulator transcription factor [Terriglobales bacterium]
MSVEAAVREPVLTRQSGRILVAEDDIALSHFLQKGLSRENFTVDLVHDGVAALQAAQAAPYDLLLLDLNLPELDGLAVLERLRPIRPHLPILVLSGLCATEERVRALDSGADDYLTKPFSFHELNARVRALLRRIRGNLGRTIRVSDLMMDRDRKRAERAGRWIALSSKEFAVLECLMANAGRPVTRAMIMEAAWGTPYDGTTNLVDVYVKYVRDKVDAGVEEKLIHTVRGIGYVIAQDRSYAISPVPQEAETAAMAVS